MSERLCPDCLVFGRCLFDEYASSIAAEFKVKEINDPEILMAAAIEAHNKISSGRIQARIMMCPNLNEIDPDYPGKELL